MCKNNKIGLFLIAIICLGAFLRFYGLDNDLWYDEVDSLLRAENIQHYYQHQLGTVKTPPLYASALSFWIKAFGADEIILRVPSFLSSLLAMIFLFYFTRSLFGARIALLSSFLCAISPFQVWYAQEARMYALGLMLILLMALGWFNAYRKGSWTQCGLFMFFFLLAMYTTYYAVLVFIPLYILLLYRKPKRLLWITAIACFFLVPVVKILLQDVRGIHTTFWLPKPTLLAPIICVENLLLGYNATLFEYHVGFLLIVFLLIYAFCKQKDIFVSDLKQKVFTTDQALLIVATLLFFPLALGLVIGQFIPIFLTRQFIIITPWLYILISYGVMRFSSQSVRRGCVVLLCALMSLSLWRYYHLSMPAPYWHRQGIHLKKPYAAIVKKIQDGIKPQDILAFSDIGTALPLFYYYLKDDDIPFIYLRIPEVEPKYIRLTWRNCPLLEWDPKRDSGPYPPLRLVSKGATIRTFYKRKFKEKSKLWLLSADWPRDGNILPHSQVVLNRAKEFYRHLERYEIEGIYIDIFSLDEKDVL